MIRRVIFTACIVLFVHIPADPVCRSILIRLDKVGAKRRKSKIV